MQGMRSTLKCLMVVMLLGVVSGCGVTQTILSDAASTTLPTGPAGPPGLKYVGSYSAQTQYVATDVVTYMGSSYVALGTTQSVSPVGMSGSARAWAVLAQAGANGAQGLTGPQGLAGAAGAQGLTGPAGARGMQGVAGAAGPGGSMGPAGTAGPAGIAGVEGPTGPAGPAGARGAAGASQVSSLQGRHLGVLGDSISANFGNAWQNIVLARTGMTLTYQDARSGRRFIDAFECWGAPSAGGQPTVFHADHMASGFACGAVDIGIADGSTFAASLAQVDLLVIALGTNDLSRPLGQFGDATNAGTFYGDMRWVVETYLAAKPTLRIAMVTVQSHGVNLQDQSHQYAAATVAYAHGNGIPVLNMAEVGGVNALTSSVLTRDGVHPSAFGFTNTYGPSIAQFLEGIY